MSFRFTTHEHYNDGTTSMTQSTVVVHELDDNESPDLLKAPSPPTYEIESGVSSEGEEEEDDDDDDYYMRTPQDDLDEERDQDVVQDHWFPSLLHRSIIEFLDDEDDDDDIYMMDHPFDMLTSNDSAVIVEQGDQEDDQNEDVEGTQEYYRHVHLEGDDDDMEQQEEEEPIRVPVSDKKRSSPPRRRRHQKRSKHVATDKQNEEVPIEVVHILI